MFQHLVVPIDGSTAAWQAVPIAASMAATVAGSLDVVTVVDRLADVAPARSELRDGVARLGPLPVVPSEHVLANDSVADAIADHLEATPGAMVVMSSHGHGRTAAVLGSVADELLRKTFGPIVVIGPHVSITTGRLDGPYVIPVDGSATAETILPIAGAWTVEFGGKPWIVEALEPEAMSSGDVFESAYVHRVAGDLQHRISREVQYETLHDDRPSRAITGFAEGLGASLVFLSTHGRTGLDRIRLGSVAAEIVRHASCPVILHRPPDIPA